MIIAYNLNSHFLKDLGSFRKLYLKLKLWVVKLLKLNIEKTWFDYQDTRCCNLAIVNVLPKLLPGPNLHFRFMKNSVYTSFLWSLVSINHGTKMIYPGLSMWNGSSKTHYFIEFWNPFSWRLLRPSNETKIKLKE